MVKESTHDSGFTGILDAGDHNEIKDATEESPTFKISELEDIKKDFKDYRGVLLPLDNVLRWKHPYHAPSLFTAITFVFLLFWMLEPSLLRTIAVVGFVTSSIDLLLPFAAPYIFSESWSDEDEEAYSEICTRMLNCRSHVRRFKDYLFWLKTEHSRLYALVMMGTCALLAWIGGHVNNLLLVYITVVTLVMTPGLRSKGIFQLILNHVVIQGKKAVAFARCKVKDLKAKKE